MKRLFATIALSIMILSATAQAKPHCKGTTAKGQPCKSVIVSKTTGYCNAHNPNAIRCGAPASSGKPCKMVVKNQGDKCRFHQPK